MSITVVEGEVDFPIPAAGKPTKTWYKVFGDIHSSQHRPVVIIHGGPGWAHNPYTILSDLTTSFSIPIVLYDQVGNGLSTHLPEKKGDTTFWTEQLFLDELDNLLAHLGIQDSYDILGHSWGGMLGARHAVRRPKGLKRLILADSPADMRTWVKVQNELRRGLPQDVQDVLKKHEEVGTTDSKEYMEATTVFNARHLCRLDPFPSEVLEGDAWLEKDPTVYLTMNGPNEFFITGSLKDWSIVDEVHNISVPTLLINGRYDEAQDEAVVPYFRSIPKVKWVTFAESAHLPFHEERQRFVEIVGTFLKDE
ncbi:hypothetical protein PLICRDRAFT_410069 [Plicaturopsis crispa FD-325 SS-3]|nr:hypothetical protein PLICRDRAFT_410069 [Plicaturopsis crispa FD-325 SS-3]